MGSLPTVQNRPRLIVIQPWEYGHLPRDWVTGAMQADEVWAYSRWVRDVYVRSGVPAERVRVVPLGANPDIFTPDGPVLDLPTHKRHRALVVGGLLERKGADLSLAAMRQVFGRADDWCLVANDMGTQSFYVAQTMRDAYLAAPRDPSGPEVLYMDDDLSDSDLAALYRSCTLLILLYRGEGFALPPLEAVSCGLPVMVTAGGPTDDYLDDSVALRVTARRRPAGELNVGRWNCCGDPWQLEPDLEAVVATLRWARDHPEELASLAAAGLSRVASGWTWERAAAVACERILHVVAPPPLPVAVPAVLWSAPRLEAAATESRRRRGRRGGHASADPVAVGPDPTFALSPADGDVDGEAAAPASKASILQARSELRGAAATPRRPVEISLCAIARDEARCIAEFLSSFRPYVGQIIVVDTRSTDRTKEIARDSGAWVYGMPWPYDFAAARNQSLAFAAGRCILVSDCDDVLPPDQGRQLAPLVARYPNLDAAFYIDILFPAAPGKYGEEWVRHVKLFPNRPDVRYEHRIHEQVLGCLKGVGIPVLESGMHVVHKNYDRSPEGQAKKRRRDFPILEMDFRERPDHPFTLFNFGMTYLEGTREYEVAAHFLRRSLERCSPNDSIVAPADAKLVQARTAREEWGAAVQANEEGRQYYPDDPHLLFQAGQLYQVVGRLDEARRSLERLVEGHDVIERGPSNPGYRTYLGRHQLALLYHRLGDVAHAVSDLRRIAAEYPGYAPAQADLCRGLVALGQEEQARAVFGAIPEDGLDPADRQLLRHLLAAR